MIHPSDIAVRVLADENERLSQALENSRLAFITLTERYGNLLHERDELARREIDRSLEIGRFDSIFEIACYSRRLRNEFRQAFGRASAWFK